MPIKHDSKECTRTKAPARYSFRNWSGQFVCPECGERRWMNLNFLGQRKLFCNGEQIVAGPREHR